MSEELSCSFCGRTKPQTDLLIAGLDAHICDRCIEQAHGIVSEEGTEGEQLSASFKLKSPKEIKSFLDQFVIGQTEAKKYFLLRFTTTTKEFSIRRSKKKLKSKKVIYFL